MRKSFSYIVLLYLLTGFTLLFAASLFINTVDITHPDINLRYLHHYKYILFILISGTALYFLLRSHDKHLSSAEENYHKLFEGSPGAVYVINKTNFKFLAVNDIMIKKYGYSREQLLQMTALDIRPKNERTRLKDYLNSDHPEGHETGVWLHQKRNGEVFYMLISHHSINFQQQDAYIVIAIDVDQGVRNEKKLREISWSNSHEIRKPLSNILGLINLIKSSNPREPTDTNIIEMLSTSANELDEIIKKINSNTTELDQK